MLTVRPERFGGSNGRSGGMADLPNRTPEGFVRFPETTTTGRENPAPGANNILRHGEERTQLLYEAWPILSC